MSERPVIQGLDGPCVPTPQTLGAVVGFYGKLPARGDFVRSALPRDFIEAWDGWWQHMIPGSREALGDGWLAAWMEAPIWRFALPAGVCGAGCVVGLWMPSVDRAGRHFPLMVAAVGVADGQAGLQAAASGFLAAAEQAGLDALEQDLTPDALEQRVAAAGQVGGDDPIPGWDMSDTAASHWWTEGGPHVRPCAMSVTGLPQLAAFTRMLDDGSAASSANVADPNAADLDSQSGATEAVA